MLLYNTTFAVDTHLEAEVTEWIKQKFIPSATEENYFESNGRHEPDILRVLGGEPGVTSIAVHLYTDSIRNIEDWYADRGSQLFSEVMERWHDKVLYFSTTLESIYAD